MAWKKHLRGEGTTAALRESPNPEDCGGQTWEDPDPCKSGVCDNSARKGFVPHTTRPLHRVSKGTKSQLHLPRPS